MRSPKSSGERGFPLLSIGIPLYRASQHVDTVVRNVTAIDYPNVEVLISDRHLHDDAIERIEEQLKDDDRVIVFRHTDRRGFVDNYNFLLRQATGKYFRWLPQDDLLPVEGLERIVSALEGDPDTILVYHRVENVDASGNVLTSGGHDSRYAARHKGRAWGYLDALSVVASLHHQAVGVGMFRREAVVGSGIEVRLSSGPGGGMRAFWYALACRGRFQMVDDVVGHYRWHPRNYSAYTPSRWADSWNLFRVARSYRCRDGSRLSRFARDIALFVSTVVVAPAIRFAWARTRKGRLARKTMQSEAGPETR